MNSKFKKIFSVALAITLGLGIIFFAWKGVFSTSSKVSFEPTVSGDTWKDSLRTISSLNPSIKPSVTQSEQWEEATSTSDVIARELLTNYILLQQSRATTTMSDTEAQAFAQILTEKINLPQGTTYTTKNLIVLSDSSSAAIATYIKRVGEIMQTFSSTRKTNEVTIFTEALTTKDAATLQKLTVNVIEYKNLQKTLLAVPTPSVLAPLHLRLVQSYANIETIITSMQKILSDPMIGLAAFMQYKKELSALRTIDTEYQNYSTSQ